MGAALLILLPEAAEEWDPFFTAVLGSIKNAFWSEKDRVAPVETAVTVGAALEAVLSATDPAREPEGLDFAGLAARPRRHIEDLVRLAQALGGRLPPELAVFRDLLAAERRDALHTLRVEHAEGVPALARWQCALIEKLNRDVGESPTDEALASALTTVLAEERCGSRAGRTRRTAVAALSIHGDKAAAR